MASIRAGFTSHGAEGGENALIVGVEHPQTKRITLVSGQNLARGSLLGKITASGKYALSASAAGDGSQTPLAILAEDTNASGGDQVTIAYFGGVFDENQVIYGAGHTAASVREALRDVGIKLDASIV